MDDEKPRIKKCEMYTRAGLCKKDATGTVKLGAVVGSINVCDEHREAFGDD